MLGRQFFIIVFVINKMATPAMRSVNFEVFGRVQGVFFRKHTNATAKKLGLVGYVRNTSSGTVVGTIEGPSDKIEQMKRWLQEKGSPESKIEKCIFSDEKNIESPSFSNFSITE